MLNLENKLIENSKRRLTKHYNSLAKVRNKYYQKNRFYHEKVLEYYKFIIQKNSSILELGCGTGNLIGNLSPSYGIGVDISDEMVKIAGFGTYKVAKRKARVGRNPRTGEQIQIAASQKVKFLPAKALKEMFNK